MNDAFLEAWQRTGRDEAGYVNNPKDPGGETNFGITIAVARANGYYGEMRVLPQDRAREIGKTQYWDIMRLDQVAELSRRIAFEIFDTGFLCGIGNAGQFLQRSLNNFNRGQRDYPDVKVDGIVGPLSVFALRQLLGFRKDEGELIMLRALNSLQGAYLIDTGLEEFEVGWFAKRVAI